MKFKKTVFAVVLMSVSTFTNAAFISGNKLNELISQKNSQNRFSDGMLHGYVSGVVDTVHGILVCTTGGVTVGQMTAIVEKYMRENPEEWNLGADQIIVNALRPIYPCPKKAR